MQVVDVKVDLDGARMDNMLANERPYCAALIGALAMSWSSLEQTMALCYSLLVNGKAPWSGDEQAIAAESFDAIESIRQKRELLLIAARRRLSKELLKDLERVLDRLDKASKKRNRVIHGRWLVSDKYPEALIHVRRFGSISDPQLYDQDRFGEVIRAIDTVHADLDDFWRVRAAPELEAAAKRHLDFMKTVAGDS